MSHIISVTNQKGGVGKTTTAVNLAGGLAKLGFQVLLIDMDPQGHATAHLGLKIHSDNLGQVSILEIMYKKRIATKSLYSCNQANLFILPSNLKLGQFNQESPQGRQFILKECLDEELRNLFHFIIIDCQPSLSLLTLNAVTAANQILLPVQAEFLALDGLTQLILTLKEVQTKLHPGLTVLGILLTMFDSRNRLSSEVQTELANNFGDDLMETVIPRNVKLAEAPSFGQTIFDYDNHSSGAKAYHNLTEEVLERTGIHL